eukprot:1162024-Pelagomonas_calceolata.AAC.12
MQGRTAVEPALLPFPQAHAGAHQPATHLRTPRPGSQQPTYIKQGNQSSAARQSATHLQTPRQARRFQAFLDGCFANCCPALRAQLQAACHSSGHIHLLVLPH